MNLTSVLLGSSVTMVIFALIVRIRSLNRVGVWAKTDAPLVTGHRTCGICQEAYDGVACQPCTTAVAEMVLEHRGLTNPAVPSAHELQSVPARSNL